MASSLQRSTALPSAWDWDEERTASSAPGPADTEAPCRFWSLGLVGSSLFAWALLIWGLMELAAVL